MYFSQKLKQHANICFAGISDFSNFLPKPESFYKHCKGKSFDTSLLSELPFFNFEGRLTDYEILKIDDFSNHIDHINNFKTQYKKNFIVIFLNINSVFNKVRELDDVLKKCDPDAFLINESKLDSSVPSSWYINKKYKLLRLDREDKGGGTNLFFLKESTLLNK